MSYHAPLPGAWYSSMTSSSSPPGRSGPAAFPPGFFERWFQDDDDEEEGLFPELPFEMRGSPVVVGAPNSEPPPEVMLQAVVTLGAKTTEGHIIEAVSLPWLEFLRHIERNPSSMHQIHWRKWEEIIAAAYKDAGYSVELTQRSGDNGRDVIATKEGLLSIRYFDQVKAYAPGRPVTLDQVHSMIGVLSTAPNVSKGIITTTSDFAPGVYTNPEVQRFVPYRLDLRPRDRLLEWLKTVARR